MRRPINWIVVSIAILFLFANLMIAGCGGADEQAGIEQPEVSGMLRKVRSASELEASLKSSLQGVPEAGIPALPIFTASGGDATFSGTYTAEADGRPSPG